MQNNENKAQRKLVDMPTLSDISLVGDIAPEAKPSKGVPFDSSVIAESNGVENVMQKNPKKTGGR